jgi:hypothetical protein
VINQGRRKILWKRWSVVLWEIEDRGETAGSLTILITKAMNGEAVEIGI